MDFTLGEIRLFPYTFAPVGWVLCDGATLTIQQNQALYSLLGTNFGGNGTTTFQLPNLMNANPLRATNQLKYYIAIRGYYPQRP